MNLTDKDIEFLAKKGISAEDVKDQIFKISSGVNVPSIVRSASIDDGILIFNEAENRLHGQMNLHGMYLDDNDTFQVS